MVPATQARPVSSSGSRVRDSIPDVALTNNRVIAALPEPDRRLLIPSMELAHIRPGTVLYNQGDLVRHVYFPVRGLISLFGVTPDGGVLQVVATDRSSLVGVHVALDEAASPHHVVAHVPCDAYRASTATLREACRCSRAVQQAVLRAAHAQIIQIGDAALCHRFHSVLQRLSRWLLAYARSTSSDTVALTQDVLSHILGSPRTAVSKAATHLQDLNAIRQRHGRIQILNRAALTQCACECVAIQPPGGRTK